MLAPIGQYFNKNVFWFASKENHGVLNYLQADIYIIVFLIFFYIGNNLKINSFKRVAVVKRKLQSPKWFYFVLTAVHLSIFLWLLKSIGFPEMLFRLTNNLSDSDTAMGLIISKYVKALSIVIILYLLTNTKETRSVYGSRIIIFINLILFILIFFPTSAARFQIIGVYLGLFLVLFQKYFSKQTVNVLFLFGLFVVFPTLEVFRNITSFEDVNLKDISKSISTIFNEGHYDSYQMFVNSINYVAEHGITWGNQLLGVFFFFVPRSIWLNKPIGSGAHVAESLNFSFSNISMPIIGEGYINFGIVGLVIFGLIFGLLCQYFDRKFWVKSKYGDNGLLIHFYPVFLGYFFFMNRGDLMSSFAFILGLFLAFYTINFIAGVFSKKSIIHQIKK